MATLSPHRAGGHRVEFVVYLPSGERYRRTVYRRDKRQAEDLLGLATRLEALTRQQALTPDLAVSFQHADLLRSEDLTRLFPERRTVAFDRQALLATYAELCRRQCTSETVISINLSRAAHLLDRLGDLSPLSCSQVERWQNARLVEVSRKTVNLELDVLRQLLDLCVQQRWRQDNPARAVKKLSWKLSRLPQALTFIQVQAALQRAWEASQQAPATTLKGCRYRLLVAGIYFGLRR